MSTKITFYKDTDSMAIEEILHFSKEKTTVVSFKKGARYIYKNIPEKTVMDWTKSKSLGKFYQSKIKDKYKASKMEIK
jgi:hypothetical protein